MRIKLSDYNKGDLFHIIRENAGLTQVEMADFLGVHERTIQKYENNEINYTIDTILQVCKRMNFEIIVEGHKAGKSND